MGQLQLQFEPNITAAEKPRLTRQCKAILERLRRGRATNGELVLIAQRFGARLYDLRRAGYSIEIVEEDKRAGLTVYELQE